MDSVFFLKNEKQKLSLVSLILLVFIYGCATILESIPGFPHTTTLIIGDTKNNVLARVEHILVSPKDVLYVNEENIHDIEIRRYAFTEAYDLVLYFYKNTFIQAGLMSPDSIEYPLIRGDYEEVKRNRREPGLKGYILVRRGNALSIYKLML